LSKFWIKANQAYNRGKIFNMLTMVKEWESKYKPSYLAWICIEDPD
jgi:hypothetical protein